MPLVPSLPPSPDGGKDSSHRARVPLIRVLPVVLTAVLIGYLQFKPDPSLRSLGFLPHAWVRFTDQHDFLNNVVGFGGFAAAVHFRFAGFGLDGTGKVIRRAAGLGAFIVLLEVAQLFLPARTCDWRDVAAGWLGVSLASLPWLVGGISHGK